MSNLTKLDFAALDISGNNYSEWVLDAEMHLKSYALGDIIKMGNTASEQNKAKAMILLRRNLHEGLKFEYLTVKDPLILWQNLKEMYDHLTTVIFSKVRYDWIHLRLQDFKLITDYNSAMFRITSLLTLCGEKVFDSDMLEKTYQTFHGSQLLLSQQYLQRGFKKYAELISCLLVAEKNSEILLKNHQSRPTGTDPFPAVNAAVLGPFTEVNATSTGQWAHTCRTPKHLVDLYKQSRENKKGKNIETNFTDEHDNFETNYADGDNYQSPKSGEYLDLDDSDFLTFDTDGEIGHVIGDGSVQKLD
ncbi:uncharacterized protein LOC141618575 [Silene latifolia]|uniref:uncharacterized protein LOC141618575 n=1 Tax=Silene latifolia TaxID=37657 RepID=UPI003D78243D